MNRLKRIKAKMKNIQYEIRIDDQGKETRRIVDPELRLYILDLEKEKRKIKDLRIKKLNRII